MPKVRILPEVLANKIAAGEIIERPASVVKELLENSLDAQANHIVVEIAHGGRQLIRVRDDGEGMSHDDALLAFEHHATSKLQSADDLFAIATLGFRGEALPSIASVCRLTLRTLDSQRLNADSNVGTEVVIHGGVMRSVKGIPWLQGTEVTVQDLFFNVPARKKFLKSNQTELGHIARLVTQYSVSFQQVAFKFIHDRRILLDCEAGSNLEERLHQVLGRQVVENLVSFDAAREGHRVHGFASRPHEQRSNPQSQYFFVNHRLVRDRFISNATRQAYGPALPQGTYPVLVVFVEAPPDEIDVNVHPAKTEVRFRNQELVHSLVRESVERALLQAHPIPRFSIPKSELSESEGIKYAHSMQQSSPTLPLLSHLSAHKHADRGISGAPDLLTERSENASDIIFQQHIINNNHSDIDSYTSCITLGCGNLKIKDDVPISNPDKIIQSEDNLSLLRPIGRLSNTYILAADSQGLVIIDQHVAHERILFERYLQKLQARKLISQRLLVPITFDLTSAQLLILDRIQKDLNSCGFEIEDFGGGTISITAVPADLDESDYRLLISEIIESFENESEFPSLERFFRVVAGNLACRSAVKANTQLNDDKVSWILSELSCVKFPHACPHGRPILLRVTMREIERRFLRI